MVANSSLYASVKQLARKIMPKTDQFGHVVNNQQPDLMKDHVIYGTEEGWASFRSGFSTEASYMLK